MPPSSTRLSFVLVATCGLACGGGSDTAADATPSSLAGSAGAGGGAAGSDGVATGGKGGTGGTSSGKGGFAGAATGGSAGIAGKGGGSGSGGGGVAGLGGAGGGGSGSAGKSGGATGGNGGGTAGAGGGLAGSGGSAGGAPVDACAGKTPACPVAPAGLSAGDGLTAIDRCAFPISEASSFGSLPALADALGTIAKPVAMADVLADLNRSAVPKTTVPGNPAGVKIAFAWDADDMGKAWWTPQGLSGSADAAPGGLVGGRRVVVVSWYHDLAKEPGATVEKGVRLSFVDVTDPAKPHYRHVLLATPTGTVAAPSFQAVNVHAGGIAWHGDLLYVVDTGQGFRVFDTTKMLQVATDMDVIGCTGGTCRAGTYKYVLPQIGAYTDVSKCSPIFSFVSLDRSTTPPALVSGEYCSSTACTGPLAGRLFRWPLVGSAGRLAPGKSWPSAAYLMAQTQVQGAAMDGGVGYLSSSAPAGGGGALYRVEPGKSTTSPWIDAPEDLMVDASHGLLWSLSEAVNARYVFGAKVPLAW